MTELAHELVDQRQARIIVPAAAQRSGYWFGGGNVLVMGNTLYLVGRYRDAGDSRTGTEAGTRGRELAIFRSTDGGTNWDKVCRFGKADLSYGPYQVISIEGSALHSCAEGVELFVSTEKRGIEYPAGLQEHQKPGTGVWTIDRIVAPTPEALHGAPIEPLFSSADSQFLHVKDPLVWDPIASGADSDGTTVVYCTHPYSWSSSNAAFAHRPANCAAFGPTNYRFFPRGYTWDVAVSRITGILPLPGALTGLDDVVNLVFYDGAECMRPHEQNAKAVQRPRGHSCEEIAGLAFFEGNRITAIERLSESAPFFVSPYGTGSSRYTSATFYKDRLIATWQQAQADGSQPLVMHSLPRERVAEIFGACA